MKPRSKKICMIAHRHAALDARIFYKEAKTLYNAGYEVHFLIRLPKSGKFTDLGGKEIGTPNQNGEWHYKGVTFHGVKVRPKSPLGKFQEYREMIRTGLKIKADVYHCHDSDIALAATRTIKRKLGSKTKFVFDSHEYWAGKWAYQFFKKQWRFGIPFCRKIEKVLLSNADALIASDFPTFGLLQNYELTRKILLLYNTIILSLFDNSEFKSKLWKADNKTLLIHNGGLDRSRGLDRILAFLDQADDTIVLGYQGIIKPSNPKEHQQIDRLTTEGKLINTDFVENYWDVGKSLIDADIGITLRSDNPNDITAAPNKLFHYMYASLPIIADDYPGMADIIQKYRCGLLVKPNDVTALKQAVEYLANNTEEAKAMGERGREAVRGELSWENHGKKLIQFYDQLLEPKPFRC